MADDEIKITIKADDQSGAALRAAGKNVEDMAGKATKATEASRLGFWTMGEAAENAAQSMGVPNQMSRQLGTSVEGLASKLGAGAMAFGLVGLAAAAAYAVFQTYNEHQKKLQEETLKAADASMKWVEASKIETKETEALKEAKSALWQVEKDRASFNLKQGLPVQAKLVQEAAEKVAEAAKKNEIVEDIVTRRIFGTKETRQKNYDLAVLDLREKQAKLQEMVAQNAAIEDGGLRRGGAKGGADEVKYIEGEKVDAHIQEYNRQLEYDRAFFAEEDRIAKAHVRDELMRRKLLEQAQANAISNTESALKMTADLHGKHGRAAFSAYKAVAIARTTIATYQAAVEAFKSGSEINVYVGAAYAAAAVAYGLAQIQTIRKQSYDGGGGSGGAVPTFSANANTGLPTGSGGGGGNITININGQKVGDYKVMAGGILKSIYESNGSVDGYDIMVARHA